MDYHITVKKDKYLVMAKKQTTIVPFLFKKVHWARANQNGLPSSKEQELLPGFDSMEEALDVIANFN